MKFRILEIKEATLRTVYKPQFKKDGWLSSWNNISRTKFSDSIYNHTKFLDWNSNCVLTKPEAEMIVCEFKKYLEAEREYVIIHNYE